MANNTKNVTTGQPKIGGAIYCAPEGTSLPTNATSDLAEAFMHMGYASEDGIVNSNSPEAEEIKAWGGDTVLTIQKERDDTFKFSLIEALNKNVMKVAYGAENVSGTLEDTLKIKANNSEPEVYSWVIDIILRGNTLKRIVIPKATLTELEDITYKDDEAVSYGFTLTAMADEQGNTHYEYLQAASSNSESEDESGI